MSSGRFFDQFVDTVERIREHPIMMSLRNGVLFSLIPAIVAMIPLFFAISSERDLTLRLMDVYLASLGIMGPSCAFFIAHFLSRSYKVRSFAGMVACAIYLLLIHPWPNTSKALIEVLRNTVTSGPFVGVLIAVGVGGLVVWLKSRWPKLRYGAEISGLALGFFIVAFFRFEHFDVHQAIRIFIGHYISTADSLSSALVIVFAMTFLWFWGMQGSTIIGSFITGVYAQLAYENMQASFLGHPAPHWVTLPFLNYVFIGGAGATFALPFYMIFSRAKRMRVLGGVSILPVLFNVNETLIYLMPLVLNTFFLIPFLCSPIIIAVTTYYAMRWEWIPAFSFYIPGLFYLPSPLMAIISTTPHFRIPHSIEDLSVFWGWVIASKSWRSGILALFQMAFLFIFYYPFFKAYERELLIEEEREKNELPAPEFP